VNREMAGGGFPRKVNSRNQSRGGWGEKTASRETPGRARSTSRLLLSSDRNSAKRWHPQGRKRMIDIAHRTEQTGECNDHLNMIQNRQEIWREKREQTRIPPNRVGYWNGGGRERQERFGSEPERIGKKKKRECIFGGGTRQNPSCLALQRRKEDNQRNEKTGAGETDRSVDAVREYGSKGRAGIRNDTHSRKRERQGGDTEGGKIPKKTGERADRHTNTSAREKEGN